MGEYTIRSKLEINKKDPNFKLLKDISTMDNPQYLFMKSHGKWVGSINKKIKYYLLRDDNGYFPRGFANKIEGDFKYDTLDHKMFRKKVEVSEGFVLRDYQEEAINDFLSKIDKENSKSGLLQGECGVGKTIIGVEMARRLNLRTLILVDQLNLADQWYNAIKLVMGLDDKYIYNGTKTKKRPQWKTVVDIMTVQSMYGSNSPLTIKEKSKYGLVIVDECHVVPAISTSVVVSSFRPKYIIGLTATPYRVDGLDLLIEGVIGKILTVVKKEALKPLINICVGPPVVPGIKDMQDLLFKDDINPSEVMSVLGDHPQKDKLYETIYKLNKALKENRVHDKLAIKHLKRVIEKTSWGELINTIINSDKKINFLIKNIIDDYQKGRHIIVLSPRIEHMEKIVKILTTKKIPCILITGSNFSKKERQKLYDKIRTGEERILIATFSIANKGLDIPILDTLHLTHPFKIKAKDKGGNLQQAIGRIIRPKDKPLDPPAIVYDYIDVGPGKNIGYTHIRYFKEQKWKIKYIKYEEVFGE